MTAKVDWIAADWGTSRLRLWPMQGNRPCGRIDSDRGMGVLTRDGYESELLNRLAEYMPTSGWLDVICCGMAGSREGWAEAKYVRVPCVPPGIDWSVRPAVLDPRLRVFLLPGVSQGSPADVMRGEETQIAGVIGGRRDFRGVICLPGTHTKWVNVNAGEIVGFRTFMTGELFALLGGQSVLRHSVGAEGWNEDAFIEAVNLAMTRPATMAGELFGIRSDALLHGLTPDVARSRLSGLLIGSELAATRDHWLEQPVLILGEGSVSGAYAIALSSQGLAAELLDVEEMTLLGLCAARATLVELPE